MDLPFELHVALRYLLARRKQAFISVISAISTLGVIVGVMALVIALALMTGLQDELRDRILGATPHIFVFKRSGITDYQAEIEKLKQMGLMPRTRQLRVAGTFNLGFYEIDSQTGLVSIPVGMRLLDKQNVDAVQLRLDDIYAAPAVANAVTAKFGNDYVAQDWTSMNQSLFSALTLEKMAISLTI